MARNRPKSGRRHRLLLNYDIGQRRRIVPFLLVLVGLAALGLTYLPPGVLPTTLLGPERRPYVLVFVVVCAALYVLTIFSSRVSMVQARPNYLYVRAGILPMAISYSRIRRLRPVRLGNHYPPSSLKGGERALLEPYVGLTAAGVDVHSFPMSDAILRRLWNKFTFLSDTQGLLLLVKDAMGLLQEIDDQYQAYRARKVGRGETSRDVFERIATQHGKSRRR